MRVFSLLCIGVIALTTLSTNAIARSSGVSRVSTTNTTGCGNSSCHGSANQATTLSIKEAVENKIMVARGQTILLTLRVANSNRPAAGANISVKATQNGFANAGTLEAPMGSGLQAVQGELVHFTPKTMTAGAAEFTFQWTAPLEDMTVFLHAAGNAVNRNGSADPQDQWNWMAPVEIVVDGPNSVQDRVVDSRSMRVSPLPAHDGITVQAPLHITSQATVSIVDSRGVTIKRETVSGGGEEFNYYWDGSTAQGMKAAPGTYSVVVQENNKVFTAKAVVVR